MNPTIYLLLPVHNRREITARFIDCLARQTYTNHHLVLIDDGSTDGTSEMVRSRISGLTVIRGEGDWWWAGSLQQGLDWLEHNGCPERDIVAFMNDDIAFEPEFLQAAVRLLDQEEGMLLPQMLDAHTGRVTETGIEADLARLSFKTAGEPTKINCLPTRGLFMRMQELRRTGGFHPFLLPHYLSDYEFTIRARRRGVPLRTSSELTISQNEAATAKEEKRGLLRWLFSKKNPQNPLYWTSFILLTHPLPYIPLNLLRIWWVSLRGILRE